MAFSFIEEVYKDVPRYHHLKSRELLRTGDIFQLMATFVIHIFANNQKYILKIV